MDPELEKNLKDALAKVINDEKVLQDAIDAVKGTLPNTVTDPALAGVKEALLADGWTAPTTSTDTGNTSDSTTTADAPTA